MRKSIAPFSSFAVSAFKVTPSNIFSFIFFLTNDASLQFIRRFYFLCIILYPPSPPIISRHCLGLPSSLFFCGTFSSTVFIEDPSFRHVVSRQMISAILSQYLLEVIPDECAVFYKIRIIRLQYVRRTSSIDQWMFINALKKYNSLNCFKIELQALDRQEKAIYKDSTIKLQNVCYDLKNRSVEDYLCGISTWYFYNDFIIATTILPWYFDMYSLPLCVCPAHISHFFWAISLTVFGLWYSPLGPTITVTGNLRKLILHENGSFLETFATETSGWEIL